MTKTTALVFASALSFATPAAGQAPAAAEPAPAPVTAPASIAIGTRVGATPTSYEDGNRCDPFASLIAVPTRTADATPGGRPVKGLPGLVLADVVVRGVIKNGPNVLAILEGPNRQSFVAHVNDKLRDASVQSIDSGGVVFAEQVAPGVRPINVRKTVRTAGEDIQ
jgi:hypothetical protein